MSESVNSEGGGAVGGCVQCRQYNFVTAVGAGRSLLKSFISSAKDPSAKDPRESAAAPVPLCTRCPAKTQPLTSLASSVHHGHAGASVPVAETPLPSAPGHTCDTQAPPSTFAHLVCDIFRSSISPAINKQMVSKSTCKDIRFGVDATQPKPVDARLDFHTGRSLRRRPVHQTIQSIFDTVRLPLHTILREVHENRALPHKSVDSLTDRSEV